MNNENRPKRNFGDLKYVRCFDARGSSTVFKVQQEVNMKYLIKST